MAALEAQAKALATKGGASGGGNRRFKRAAASNNDGAAAGNGGGGAGAAYLEMVKELKGKESEGAGGGKWLVR